VLPPEKGASYDHSQNQPKGSHRAGKGYRFESAPRAYRQCPFRGLHLRPMRCDFATCRRKPSPRRFNPLRQLRVIQFDGILGRCSTSATSRRTRRQRARTAKAKMCDKGHFAPSTPAVSSAKGVDGGGRHDCSCEKDRHAACSMIRGVPEEKPASI
jgi:hypothetical protein